MSVPKIPAELEKQLMTIGLTNYQARVYRAVYILKKCTISQIANYSKVPAAKIYTVVRELEAMGLIAEILKTRPAMFKAFPPDQYIEQEKNRIIEIGAHIKESLASLEKFRKEKVSTEKHETLLIENKLLIKNMILDSLTPVPQNVLVVIHDDIDFYEEILAKLARELDPSSNVSISITLIDPYERKLDFLSKFPNLNIETIVNQDLSPNLSDILKKIPLLFVIDESTFINITHTEQKLEYLYFKSSLFADFLRASLDLIT